MIGDLPAHALAVGLDIGPEGLVCYRAPGAGGEIYEDVAREERLDYARQAVALRGSLHALQEARRGLAPREVEHLCVRLDVGPADTLVPAARSDRTHLPGCRCLSLTGRLVPKTPVSWPS